MSLRLRLEDYTVGWVCALPVELAAAQEMLDEEHDTPQYDPNDSNIYTCGRIGEHNVVVACLPEGQMGTSSAAAVATQMKSTFQRTRFGLMVGIGGGVPSEEADIRLGDVVVSKPLNTHGGVVQYDFGKATITGFERTGVLNTPPIVLLNAVANLRAKHMRGKGKWWEYLSKLEQVPTFNRSSAGSDVLFDAEYDHAGGPTCKKCSEAHVVERDSRSEVATVHYGIIASGNRVLRDAVLRDKLSAQLGGVLCFEMEAAGLMNSFPCLVVRGICDYADSHKNKKWQAYAAGTAAAYAKELLLVIPAASIAEAPTIEKSTAVDNNTSKEALEAKRREQECLRSLDFPEQKRRHVDIHAAVDSCEWLFTEKEYITWMKKRTSLFWIKGDPGAGKSVLMKHSLKRLRRQNPHDAVVSFFFHGQGTLLQKTLLGLFRALLALLLPHFPEHLSDMALEFVDREVRYGRYADHKWSWNEHELRERLSGVLVDTSRDKDIFMFIDALDECGEAAGRSLLTYFKNITTQAGPRSKGLKICVSSRHYPIIGHDSVPSVRVEQKNNQDISRYLEKELKDVQPRSKREQILHEILSKSKGSFQWTFLVTRAIVDDDLIGTKLEYLLRESKSCPETLGELYDTILRSVPKRQQRQMVKVFQWVQFAERPLSPRELRDALAADEHMEHKFASDLQAYEGWSDSELDFERHVKHISGGLIRFSNFPQQPPQEHRAQLIHQSVADFLIKSLYHRLNSSCNDRSWSGSSHFQISRSCLRYMNLKNDLDRLGDTGDLVSSSNLALARYAVEHLFVHIRKVEKEGINQFDLLSAVEWKLDSKSVHTIAARWSALDPQNEHTPPGWPSIGGSSLHVLASFGSMSAINSLFELNFNDFHAVDNRGDTSLMVAIRAGQEKIAWLLLKRINQYEQHVKQMRSNPGSTPFVPSLCANAKNKDGYTAVDLALERKMHKLVIALIKAGAELKIIRRQSTLVALAISSKNMTLFHAVIEKRMDLEGTVFFALTDETTRRSSTLISVISQLLGAGANTGRSLELDGSYQSWGRYVTDDDAIHVACRDGSCGMVQLLLAYSAPVHLQNRRGHCPLFIAALQGNEALVELILKKAPLSVLLEDHGGNTALGLSFERENFEITKLLLRHGNFSNINGQLDSIFSRSAERGSVDIVEIILQRNLADLEYVDEEGNTALLLAAKNGHDVVVRRILESNECCANSEDPYGWTPLAHSAYNGHVPIVMQLLEVCGVDIDSKDNYYYTPLSKAAAKGHNAVVELLLCSGKVEVDSKDAQGMTAMLWAIQNGNNEVVTLLLDSGKVDTAAEQYNSITPILWAMQNRHHEAIKLLLDSRQADMNYKELDGMKIMQWASRYGNEAVVRLMLDSGQVDVNSKDPDRTTPLLWAVQNGHETIVKLLLSSEQKVDVASGDRFGLTPLFTAWQNGNNAVVKLLLDAAGKSDRDLPTQGWTSLKWVMCGDDASFAQLVQKQKIRAHWRDNNGWTPLLWAAERGYCKASRILLSMSAIDVNIRGPLKRTPLGWAVMYGHKAVVQMLLENWEVDVNSKDMNGTTPLMCAIQRGYTELYSLLLHTEGIKVDIEDNAGFTPLSWATKYEQKSVVELLEPHVAKQTTIQPRDMVIRTRKSK